MVPPIPNESSVHLQTHAARSGHSPDDDLLTSPVVSAKINRMAGKSKGVTLRDVAARAGVSVATASVAIAGRPSGNCMVSEPVARRIRSIAKELRYRPNIYAQRLSKRNSHTIALVIKSSIWHNIMWSIGGVQQVFKDKGYEEIFCMHPNSLEAESRHLERCLEARVKGMLVFPLLGMDGKTNAAKCNEIAELEQVPIVQIGIALPGCRVPSVVADEQQGVYDAVQRLAQLGHKRITHITLDGYAGASPASPFMHAHQRYRGYEQAMSELNLKQHVLTIDPNLPLDNSFESAVELTRKLLTGRTPPTAMVVYSDTLAAAALTGARATGLQVPEDVSIVGVDKSAFTDVVRPKLGMVMLPHHELGMRGAQMLLDMIDGVKTPVTNVRVRSPFDEGQTVAPPRPRSKA